MKLSARRLGALLVAGTAALALTGIAAPTASAAPKPAKDGTIVTNFTGPNGGLPSDSPHCYTAAQTWNHKAACFGATYVGGTPGYGALYATDPDGSNLRVIFNFNVFNGLMPSQAPVLGPDGATLYGVGSQGGSSGSGSIFSYNMQTQTATTLGNFTGPNGSTEQGQPIIVGNNLYGIAGQGGAYSYGVLWTMPLSGGPIQVLHSFAGGDNDFATSFGSPFYNPADGLIYGLMFAGGPNHTGGIFSINPDGTNYQMRANFDMTTGAAPQMGSLIIAPNGLMYGNGWLGGANKLGTIFSFNPATNQLATVFNYTSESGTQPYNGLQLSPSGKWLYSIGWQGGKYGDGTIVAVAIDGSSFHVLKDLKYSTTGGQSFAAPTLAGSGNRLLAAMSNGGSFNIGTLVSMVIPSQYL